ncbi:hypothetical protein QM797_19280 [Rhodococcus sp. IEGM 1381]|uniref:esterase/lipase family protein n=1 Tax=Rhodococcus sp. IEGM 1381 TaxID=3047085 RepID=UPI0024B76CFE|nr:hypothetical protein [Rhodococcus sp. IEGM 1381]MDI9896868.1 hypothetical protein [Rhodococcus sp. IEGM 1381]
MISSLSIFVSPAAASPGACTRPTILVHDLASSEKEWDGWVEELGRRGICAFAFTYGASVASVLLQRADLEVAGLTSIEDSAVELGAFVESVLGRTGAEDVQLLAHGAGGLVAQQWIARSSSTHVRSLVTVGPLWNGTDLAGLGTVAAFNRRIGIYDTLAAMEKPVLEPICAVCGQIIANSGYMAGVGRDGWMSPGVQYVNVISRYDGLMTSPLSAALPGSESLIIQDLDVNDRTNHAQLMRNPLVRQLALDAVTVE